MAEHRLELGAARGRSRQPCQTLDLDMDISVSVLIDRCADQIREHADTLTALDQAIGDGDHGINMRRGLDAVEASRNEIEPLAIGPALEKIGMTLVMNVGGASGPLYGSLLIGMGKNLTTALDLPAVRKAFRAGIEMVQQRGRSQAGEKTLLDVLLPVADSLEAIDADPGPDAIQELVATARNGMESTKMLQATKGRAAFLGERSVGHIDPGAMSSCLLIESICQVVAQWLRGRDSE